MCLFFATVTAFLFYVSSSSEVYHVTPTAAESCPVQPCVTLSGFASRLNNNFHVHSNTTLIFTSGEHRLTSVILIEDIDQFSMVANSSLTSVTISCEESATWSFLFVGGVYIRNLNFVTCNFQVYSVPRFVVKCSNFSNHTGSGSALDLLESDGYIIECNFVSNSGGYFIRHDINGYVGAVIVTLQSSVEIINSSFQNNSAELGGVLFSEVGGKVTLINCSFMGNNATRDGGVFYLEAGCSLSVYNSIFRNNSAGNDGGVFVVINSTVNIHLSSFIYNHAQYEGGVIYAKCNDTFTERDSIIISKSNFTENLAFVVGGVLVTHNISVVIKDDNHFGYNYADLAGGAVYLVDGLIKISNSLFLNNTVEYYGGAIFLSHAGVDIYATQFINNTAEIGGAIGIEWVDMSISNCGFVNNTALVTGGVMQAEFKSNIKISTSKFTGNHAQNGAVILSDDNTTVNYYDVVMEKNTASYGIMYFIESSAITFTGHVIIKENSGSLIFYYSNAIFTGTTIIVNGIPDYKHWLITLESGAITAFQSNIDFIGQLLLNNNSATNGGAITAVSSKLQVYGDISMYFNTARVSGGGMYLYQSEIICKSNSNIQIIGNKAMDRGGGIHAISSTIILEYYFHHTKFASKLLLISNNATRYGGGVCLESAKLKVLHLGGYCNVKKHFCKYTILFFRNTASYGGAIYVADDTISGTCKAGDFKKIHSTVTECFFQTARLEKNINTKKKSKQEMYMKFTHNYAFISGSNLYGGLLDRCTQSLFNEIVKTRVDSIYGIEYLMLFSNINTSSISSDPVQVCFCFQNKPNCTNKHLPISITKGEKFIVPLAAVDQAHHVISSTIYSTLNSNESGIGEGQLIQSTNASCTNLTFNVFSPYESEELIVYADGPCKDATLSQRKIQLHFLPCSCPIGFQPKISERTRCVCECDSKIANYITECDYKTETFVRKHNSWITYVSTVANFSDYLIYRHCPLHYCKNYDVKTKLNLNSPDGVNAQCAHFRSGTLCGACQSNYSLSLGSSRCIVCPRYWPAILIIIFIAALLAGVALVTLILVLNLTVAVGTLNGLIFYANIINANIQIFFPSSQPSFFSVFISWLNLDIGLDTCLFPGMDAYSKTWLQFVFPAYIIFLVVMVILISDRSRRFSQLIGRKNPIATLATLILLSYAKLLHTIIASLSSAILKYPGPNGGYSQTVWLPDATVEYLRGKHIVLFLAAILILVVGVAYTTLIFSWQWLLRFSESRLFSWTRNAKLHLFISETYHAPYTPKNRHWTGLLLFVRVFLYVASAANISGDEKVDLLMTGCVTIALLLTNQILGVGSRVYKKWPTEILEIICHTNLALLCLAIFFSLEDQGKRITVTNISMTVTLLLLLAVLFYHLFTELIAKRCKKYLPYQRLDRPLHTDNTEMTTHASSVIEKPQGNISYNPGLRESLLDGDNGMVPAY